MFLIPDVGTIFWMSIIFGITIFVLAKYAWKPLISILNEREKAISTALESASEAETKIEFLRNEQKRIVTQTQLEKERIIKEASEQRELIIQEAKKRATQETQKLISDASAQIKSEREKAILEVRSQIALLSIDIASKLIYTEMDDRVKQMDLVKKLVEKVDLN